MQKVNLKSIIENKSNLILFSKFNELNIRNIWSTSKDRFVDDDELPKLTSKKGLGQYGRKIFKLRKYKTVIKFYKKSSIKNKDKIMESFNFENYDEMLSLVIFFVWLSNRLKELISQDEIKFFFRQDEELKIKYVNEYNIYFDQVARLLKFV